MLTARYGYKQADEEVDRWIAAILYGAIAFSTCAFDGLAVRLWFKGAHKSSVFTGVVASIAFLVTFTNGLGGIASRADAVRAQRQALADSRDLDRRELKQLEEALADLRFVPTDAEAVAAAKHAANVAASNRQVECDKRGPNCRQRELDDREAARKLAEATSNKATTDRGKALETQISVVKEKLDRPVVLGHANPLGVALKNILGKAADILMWWQQAIVALAFELCLVCMMIGYTVLGEVAVPTPLKSANPVGPEAEAPKPAPAALPAPSRPKLVAFNTIREPPTSLIAILTQILDKAPWGRVAITALYGAYATRVRPEQMLAKVEFGERVGKFCGRVGIEISGQYLVGVKLVASLQPAATN